MAERDRFEEVVVNVPAGAADGFHDAARKAGWSDDPGTGKAILVNGAEILNPQPMAPPVGYQHGDTLQEMIERHVAAALVGLRGDDIVDESIEDADDFDIDEGNEVDLETIYTVREMVPEAPGLRPEARVEPVPDPAGADPA